MLEIFGIFVLCLLVITAVAIVRTPDLFTAVMLTGIFSLLMATTFFLLVMNSVYAFFDTFGIIDTTTDGGPGGATSILVYKVYRDGFVGLDLGSSSAQSVILMGFVIALTFVQFRYVERMVHYKS